MTLRDDLKAAFTADGNWEVGTYGKPALRGIEADPKKPGVVVRYGGQTGAGTGGLNDIFDICDVLVITSKATAEDPDADVEDWVAEAIAVCATVEDAYPVVRDVTVLNDYDFNPNTPSARGQVRPLYYGFLQVLGS